MKDTQGRVAFVTGGGSGIGLGIARAFVSAGMKVMLADLRTDHLRAAVESFAGQSAADDLRSLQVDVADRDGIAEAARQTESVFWPIHVLVNNAGVAIEVPIAEMTYADWDYGLDVNLGGVVNGLQTFLPCILRHGQGGHIVNTASLAALVVMPGRLAAYAAAKAAVLAMSEAIRADLAEQNIGVTALCPGPVQSNIHEVGRNRPARYPASAAFAESAARLAERPVSSLWMRPEDVGLLTLRAVRENTPYVITHGEWRSAAMQRHAQLLNAMPDTSDPRIVSSLRGAGTV